MFGIGGGELMFIMFIVLMMFGSDKIPEIARTLGKGIAQLKNATNEIKSEIHKGADSHGLSDTITNINAQITQAKENMVGDAPVQVEKLKEEIDDITGPIKRQL